MVVLSTFEGFLWAIGAYTRPWTFPHGHMCNFWPVLRRNSYTIMVHGPSQAHAPGRVLFFKIRFRFRQPENHTTSHTAWHMGVSQWSSIISIVTLLQVSSLASFKRGSRLGFKDFVFMAKRVSSHRSPTIPSSTSLTRETLEHRSRWRIWFQVDWLIGGSRKLYWFIYCGD